MTTEQTLRNLTLVQNLSTVVTTSLDGKGYEVLGAYSIGLIGAISNSLNLARHLGYVSFDIREAAREVNFFQTETEERVLELADLLDEWRKGEDTERVQTEAKIAALASASK